MLKKSAAILLGGLFLIGMLLLGSCQRNSKTATANQKTEEHDHGHAEHKGDHAEIEAEGEEHEDHEEGEEASDLDVATPELLAKSCEHKMPTHECAECRYEVGVARVPADMIKQGIVKLDTVKRQNLDLKIFLNGEIQFDKTKVVQVGPPLAGIVKGVYSDAGKIVKAGDILFEIDSPDLAEAEGEYLSAKAAQRVARKHYDRQMELRDANVNSERELLDAQKDYEEEKIRADAAASKLLRLGLSRAEIAALARKSSSNNSGRLKIRAPFAGTVARSNATVGELVEPGQEVMLIGDSSKMWLWVDLYERHLKILNEWKNSGALTVKVTINAYPGEEFSGEIDFIGTVMEEKTRTVKSRIVISNADGKMLAGMFAKAEISQLRENVIVVPETSVLSDEGREFVFIRAKEDYFIRRPIKRGGQSDGYIEINEGLEEGQTVVIDGGFLLKSDVLRSKMGAGCAD